MSADARDLDTLAALQSTFGAAITATGLSLDPALADVIVPGGSLTLAGALDVYRGGYLARLTEQLGETYATVWRVLGDVEFFALCECFITAHRSDSYNLSDYGRAFPAFLGRSSEVGEFPFLPELARLELAFHDLFHAPGHDCLEAAELAAVEDLEASRFRFGEAVRLLAFESEVYGLFQHRNDDVPPDLTGIAKAQHVLLFKRDGEVMARVVDAATACGLEALSGGATVGDALERVLASHPGFGPEGVTELFAIVGSCGLVTAVER